MFLMILLFELFFEFYITLNTSDIIFAINHWQGEKIWNKFMDWHRNLRILLKQEKKLYVLETFVLEEEPTSSAPNAKRNAYNKHVDDALVTSCFMLATMNYELQKQHENMTTLDIIDTWK